MGSWTHAVTEAVKKSGGGEEAKGSWFESITHAGCPTSVEPSGGYRDKRSCPLSDWVRFVYSSVFCFVCVCICVFREGEKKKVPFCQDPSENNHIIAAQRGGAAISRHSQSVSLSTDTTSQLFISLSDVIESNGKKKAERFWRCVKGKVKGQQQRPPPNLFHILVPRSSLPNKRNANGLIQRSGLGMSGRSARFRQRQCFDRPCNS